MSEPTVTSHATAQRLRASLGAALSAEAERTRARPELLARPLVVLVPSRIARAYWIGALAADVGACAGVRVMTLWSAALEVLRVDGAAPLADDALFDALVAAAAAREPRLSAELAAYDDALALVAASASDLLSAGLEPTVELGPTAPARERTLAIARAALDARRGADACGIARHGDVYARAALRVASAGWSARRTWIVGVADATGQLARFLHALESRGAELHTLGVAREPGASAARITHSESNSLELEWDEVALGLRTALDRGCAPERLAIVSRASVHEQVIARSALALHGIPLQGGSVDGALSPRGRRAQARLDLAAQGGSAPLDAWLDALGSEHELDAVREDLRLSLRALGCARLQDLADLDLSAWPAGATLALPARGASNDADEDDDEDAGADSHTGADSRTGGDSRTASTAARPERRRIRALHLHAARRLALALCARIAAQPERAPAGALRAWLAAWDAGCGGTSLEPEWLSAPDELVLTARDYRALVARRAREACATPLCGAESGVWWLSPEQAHGLCFEAIYAPGLWRGVFPRAAGEDPLLPDAERARLRAVLPALAQKSARADEERRLWAELLRCAERVHLSHARRDADGRPLTPAPYLRAELRARAAVSHAATAAAADSSGTRPLPARRHLHALATARAHGPLDASTLAHAIAAAQREARDLHALDAPATALCARGRAQIQLEHDAPPWRGLGPQHGWCGALSTRGRYATFFENVARCGWQAFLARELGIEERLDPLNVLPELDALLIGTTVHAALEHLLDPRPAGADRGAPLSLAQLLEHEPQRVARPPVALWDAALLQAATRALHEQGVHYDGLAAALAHLSRPRLQRALELTLEAGEAWIYGVEVEGRCEFDGLEIRFRADRVDAAEDGPRLYDYKAGRPRVSRKQFGRALRRGTLLQAACYAAGADHASGCYVHLHPDITDAAARLDTRELVDDGRREAASALAVLARALERGVLAPRPLLDGKLNAACKSCAVSSACSRLDSGWRLRLQRAQASARDSAATAPPTLTQCYEQLEALAHAELGP
jgi:hypothetical protein